MSRRLGSAAAVLSSTLLLGLAVPTAAAHAAGAATPVAGIAYGITTADRLVHFDPAHPAAAGQGTPITGFGTGQLAAAMDLRASDGKLFVLTDDVAGTGRLYVVSPLTAVAVRVGTATYRLGRSLTAGYHFDIDIDPVDGTLRIVGSDRVDLTVSPATGAVLSTDRTLTYVATDRQRRVTPRVVGAAYTGGPGATSTTLYDVDAAAGYLVRQGDVGGRPASAKTGQLHSIGRLFPTGSTSLTNLLGFDIRAATGTAYLAALTVDRASGGTSNATVEYAVNLRTGIAAPVGPVGSDILETYTVGTAPAVSTAPPPALPELGMPALAGVGAAAAGLVVIIRRRRSPRA